MNNLKSLRKELKQWGRYWAAKEATQGYGSKSNLERVKECCELGGYFSSDAHLFSHGSSGIDEPPHIKALTAKIEQLSENCRLAIVGRYLKQFKDPELKAWANFPEVRSVQFWLIRAENALL
ncbi:hypothetical protein [Pseudoalteromonas sp. S2755]|uniref:hypothetical protein n=1 Tax=Pseudoalteromonas sp. S2755 TaxID=2066523 RepID=UPI00110A303E|nr:hypothetical protein [Pseudoalteromonas sp. S2755]TMN34123.1 hypothetical protein CWC03_17180 [Pseudoalteromonas sp. S2755]